MTDDLVRRAMAAYFRNCGGVPLQPASGASGVEEYGGRSYVVLRNNSETLAVYRVRTNGVLKGLRRWPRDVYYPGELRRRNLRERYESGATLAELRGETR